MSELPPPPGAGGLDPGAFPTWSPLSPERTATPTPLPDDDRYAAQPPQRPQPDDDRYATPPPPPSGRRGSGNGCLIAGVAVVSLLVGVIATIAVVSLDDGDDYSGGSPATSAAAPTATAETPAVAVPGLPPLEHDLDVYGDTGTCVSVNFNPVACEEEHLSEIFARIAVPGEEFPGADVLQAEHATRCEDEYVELTGESSFSSGQIVLGSQPTEAAWEGGQHDIVCIVTAFEGTNEGPIAAG